MWWLSRQIRNERKCTDDYCWSTTASAWPKALSTKGRVERKRGRKSNGKWNNFRRRSGRIPRPSKIGTSAIIFRALRPSFTTNGLSALAKGGCMPIRKPRKTRGYTLCRALISRHWMGGHLSHFVPVLLHFVPVFPHFVAALPHFSHFRPISSRPRESRPFFEKQSRGFVRKIRKLFGFGRLFATSLDSAVSALMWAGSGAANCSLLSPCASRFRIPVLEC